MKLTRHDMRTRVVSRRHGEIQEMAEKYGRSYGSLWRWCKNNPHLTTEELARRGPMDPAEAGRKGGLIRQGKVRRGGIIW